jgi:predicted phage terminase large subunit-like protein
MSSLKASDYLHLQRLAEKEKLRRLLKRDLIEFTRHFFESRGEEFIENWHHHEIADALARVRSGEIKNLLINMPPRYGKTELAVINWIAQCLAENPACKFIHLSYSDDLALDNSSKTRDLIRSDEFQDLWKLKLKDDADSKKKWYTEQGGGLYATAAGGAITGFGAGSTSDSGFAGAIIIDDPLKVDDAQRKLERDKINNRLNATIKSRRNNRNTPIIIIMQRLHEEDLSGFVLANGMGEPFYHLKLSAIQPDGSALWDTKHTIEELEREKATDPFTFSGQMQQEPSPEDGTFFKKDWFKRYNLGEEPERLTKYGAGDYAVSEGKGDFTEQAIGGFDIDENLWLLDWWSGQTAADKWIDEQIILVKEYDPVLWVAEAGVIRRSVEPFIKQQQRIKSTYYRMEWLNSNQNKAANARAFQAIASQGKVYIPNTAWGDSLLFQLLQFPAGKYDDKVDVCGLFGRILHQTYAPSVLVKEETKKRDAYASDDDENSSDWKAS